jgi:hypothetical protein
VEKIILYREERPDIKIYMEMFFNEKGQLIFEGQDIGRTVEDWWGDSDYEYSYTIEPVEVEKLYALLGVASSDKRSFLEEIKKRFGGNKAYSKFGDFMREYNIDFKAFTWT